MTHKKRGVGDKEGGCIEVSQAGRASEVESQQSVTRMQCFFQAEDGIRDLTVTGVQTCALPISPPRAGELRARAVALLDLRAQLSRPRTGATAFLEHAVSLGLRIEQLGGRLGELLEIGRESCRERV